MDRHVYYTGVKFQVYRWMFFEFPPGNKPSKIKVLHSGWRGGESKFFLFVVVVFWRLHRSAEATKSSDFKALYATPHHIVSRALSDQFVCLYS